MGRFDRDALTHPDPARDAQPTRRQGSGRRERAPLGSPEADDSAYGRWATVATMTAAVAVDLFYGKEASLVVTLVFGPFVACALTSVRATGIAAVAAVVLSVALGWPDGTMGSSAQVVRVVAVAVGGGLAVWLAIRRTRREAKLVALTRVAEAAQQTILRPLPDEIAGMRVTARYLSASAEAHVGGDFYDAAATPWGMRLLVGDVRGKGLEAVRLASVLLGEFRSRVATESDMGALVRLVDAAGARHVDASGEDFATAVFVEFAPGSVTMVRCGHPLPLVVAGGAVTPIQAVGSLPLCMNGTPVVEATFLPAGARMLLFSDGAFEGRDRLGNQFELAASLARHAQAAPTVVLDGILADLEHHCARGIDDDVVLVLVEEATS